MNIHTIVTKEPNQVVPRGYLQEVLKHCPTCIGITIQDKDGDKPILDCASHHKTMDVDDLMKIVDSCKDVRMVLVFGNLTQDFNPETDMQPFVFQQKADDGLEDVVAFHVEGDFPNYSKPGKGHTDEYNFWEDCIYPTLLEKFQASSDLTEFFEKIRTSQMQQICENPIGHRGVAVFVPLEGDPIVFGQRNDLGGEFDWGQTSNTFGWGAQTKLEQAAEAVVSGAKKAGGRLAKLMGTAASVPEVPAKPEKTEPAKPDVKNPDIKTDNNGIHHTSGGNDPFAAWPGTSNKTHVMRTVPSGLQGNARNAWIRLFLGLDQKADLPKNKDHKGFMLPVPLQLDPFAQEDVSTKDSVRDLADRVKKFPGSKGDTLSKQMKDANADANAQVQKPAKAEAQRPTDDFLPECPPDEAKASADLVTEWATNPKKVSALDVQRIESKWPLFTTSRGIKLEDVARWSIADKKIFVKTCPNDAARLISELVLKLHEFGAFDPAVNTEHQNDKDDKSGDKSQNGAPPQPGPSQTPPAGKKSRLQRLTAA